MNIIAIRLVLIGTKPGLVVMCKILTVVVKFYLCVRVNSTFLGRDSLPLVLILLLFLKLLLKLGLQKICCHA